MFGYETTTLQLNGPLASSNDMFLFTTELIKIPIQVESFTVGLGCFISH